TALALHQGGYDWGFLAYGVGFGGSMIWFGSSAGVALSNMYPEAKSVGAYLKAGWHVSLAYVAGFFVLLFVHGWHVDVPVTRMAVGFNNFSVPEMTRRKVLGTNTPDVLTETTADFGFALLMATARRMTESEHYLRAGKWTRWSYDMFSGADVHGTTLGILGM